MSNENKTIHDFEFNLICEFFSSFERQGPGSPEVTIKALSFIDNLSEKSQIADLGCGTGGQTMVLAKNAPGKITGIDLFPLFIDLFNKNAAVHGLEHRVKGITGSMDNLPFYEEQLDLIWSEGAIYNIGFERGLKEWRKFIKKGGYIAVSEATWFTANRPAEVKKFWLESYPEIDTMHVKLEQMQKAGYIPVAAFNLPENCWTKHFYDQQVKACEIFLEKYKGNKTAEDFIESERYEADLYYRFKEYYGYTFYIGRKL